VPVLAAPPEDYARYVEAVREEYAQVPEDEFLAGRLAILIELEKKPLFRTGKGQRLLAAANQNLEDEIRSLSDRLGIPVEGSPA